MDLKYNSILDILGIKDIAAVTTTCTLPARLYKISDPNLMFDSSITCEVKVKVTIDDIRLRFKLTLGG